MRSVPRLAPLRLSILLSAMLVLSGCASAGPIVAPRTACSSLLPEAWKDPVPGAPLPSGETVGDWIQFGDAQTGQLDKANDRTLSAIGIVGRCEQRDLEAVARARRKWWQVWK